MTWRWIVAVWSLTLVSDNVGVWASDPPGYVIEAPDILTIEATGLAKGHAGLVTGEHLVRPDGTINLGPYGPVRVAGLKVAEARAAVGKHLSRFARKKRAIPVRVAVLEFNSKHCYVVKPGATGEDVVRLPLTGNETVLDAIRQVDGLGPVAARGQVTVMRDGKAHPVDWRAITRKSRLDTNYPLMPGDVVRVAERSR